MQVESNQLFHEMMHAYRAYKEVPTTYNGSTLNGETEALYAQYLYVSKLPEYPKSKWEKRYNSQTHYKKSKDLEDFIDEKGRLRPGKNETELEIEILNQVIPALRSAGYSTYPYDYSRDALDNFSNIRELTKDCI